MNHSRKEESSKGIDDFEIAKLQAQESAVAAFKKSVKWIIISFFVIAFGGCLVLWLSSFKW